MNHELQNALDKIQASDALKDSTARFLRNKMAGRHQTRTRPHFRLTAVSTAMVLLILISSFSYNFYLTPNAYVDMDVNPSIGLTLNRFGRVIDAGAYNDDGAIVLADINVRFKPYDEAASILLNVMIAEGYLAEDGLISVTVQADSSMENDMLAGLNQTVAMSLTGHHANAQTDIYAVTNEIRINAQEHHVTPARYLAITGLQAVDPTATFEGCMGHSIGELHELTREHGANHNSLGEETNRADHETGAEVFPEEASHGQMGGHHGGGGNGHD